MTSSFTSLGVCVDDSDAARAALEAARSLRPPDGRLTLVHVVEPPSFLVELSIGIGGGLASDTDAMIEAAQAWLESLAEPGEDVVVLAGKPVAEVTRWAEESGCDLLVLATNRGTVEHTMLGSFTLRLTAAAPCSTLLVQYSPPD